MTPSSICGVVPALVRLMELDPESADVIAWRWQEFTGKKAVREADGVEFDDVITDPVREHSEE